MIENSDLNERNHTPQVIPWAVLNEVRTSLAATRYLLFPLHSDTRDPTLLQVYEELSRLEAIFTKVESVAQVDIDM